MRTLSYARLRLRPFHARLGLGSLHASLRTFDSRSLRLRSLDPRRGSFHPRGRSFSSWGRTLDTRLRSFHARLRSLNSWLLDRGSFNSWSFHAGPVRRFGPIRTCFRSRYFRPFRTICLAFRSRFTLQSSFWSFNTLRAGWSIRSFGCIRAIRTRSWVWPFNPVWSVSPVGSITAIGLSIARRRIRSTCNSRGIRQSQRRSGHSRNLPIWPRSRGDSFPPFYFTPTIANLTLSLTNVLGDLTTLFVGHALQTGRREPLIPGRVAQRHRNLILPASALVPSVNLAL